MPVPASLGSQLFLACGNFTSISASVFVLPTPLWVLSLPLPLTMTLLRTLRTHLDILEHLLIQNLLLNHVCKTLLSKCGYVNQDGGVGFGSYVSLPLSDTSKVWNLPRSRYGARTLTNTLYMLSPVIVLPSQSIVESRSSMRKRSHMVTFPCLLMELDQTSSALPLIVHYSPNCCV